MQPFVEVLLVLFLLLFVVVGFPFSFSFPFFFLFVFFDLKKMVVGGGGGGGLGGSAVLTPCGVILSVDEEMCRFVIYFFVLFVFLFFLFFGAYCLTRLFEWTEEELKGKNFSLFLPPILQPQHQIFLKRWKESIDHSKVQRT